MKTLVIYKSKSGFSKKYAEWISEELHGELLEYSKASAYAFENYDAVVFGGGLYAGGINGVRLITDNLDKLAGKRVAVYATGATPPRPEALEEITGKNFTSAQLEKMKFFYLRGGFDYSKLGLVDKFLMMLLKWKIQLRKLAKAKMHPDEFGMLAAYDQPLDLTKRKNIEALVKYIKTGTI